MDKQSLHDRLANIGESAEITVDEIIEVYGNDNSAEKIMKTGKKTVNRADLFAQTYNLLVRKEADKYIFTKI